MCSLAKLCSRDEDASENSNLFCLEQKVEMFKHITWNEHIWLIGWKVLAKLWWQRLASSEIPCFVLSPPATYTLHLFTLFLHLSSFSPQLYRTLACALPFLYKSLLLKSHSSLLQLPTSSDCGSRATPFYLTTNTQLLSANILQHTDFFFSFTKDFQEFYMTCNTHLSQYCTTHRFSFSFYKGF